MSGATAEFNPNEGDTPGYGSLADGSIRHDQQVMGAQSIATAAQNIQEPEVRGEDSLQGFLDMDGETRPATFDQACGRDDGQDPGLSRGIRKHHSMEWVPGHQAGVLGTLALEPSSLR